METKLRYSYRNCGSRAKNRVKLSVRGFVCESCGVSIDRDVNAASNMLIRAGFNPLTVENVRPLVSLGTDCGCLRLESPCFSYGENSMVREKYSRKHSKHF